jgi:hypothetical protein
MAVLACLGRRTSYGVDRRGWRRTNPQPRGFPLTPNCNATLRLWESTVVGIIVLLQSRTYHSVLQP